MAHQSEASKLIRVRHTSRILENLDGIREIMDLANIEFVATVAQYRALAEKEINAQDLEKYIRVVFDLKENKVLVTPAWRDLTKDSLLRSSRDWIDTIRFYTAGSGLFVKIGGIAENSQIQGYINLFFKIDLKTGKLEDAVFDIRKHKDFVIDYSNLDLNHSAIDQYSLDLCHDSRPFVVQ